MQTPATWLRIAAFLSAGAVAFAQARKPCFLAIVDAAGKAVPEAQVTVFWRHGATAPGDDDILQLVADKRGRCQPRLILGRLYTCYAIGPERADGSRSVSDLTTRVIAGSVVDISLEHPWTARMLRLEGAAGCVGSADAEVVFCPCSVPSLATVLEAGSGRVPLPPAPHGEAWVGVRLPGGDVQQAQAVQPWVAAPFVGFRKPLPVHLLVLGPDGKPASDVSIHGPVQEASTTGARGRRVTRTWSRFEPSMVGQQLAVPRHALPTMPTWLVVSAAGCGPTWISVPIRNSMIKPEPLEVPLTRPRELRLPLRGLREHELVAASLQVLLGARANLGLSPVVSQLAMHTVDGELRAVLPSQLLTTQLVATLTPGSATSRPRTLAMSPDSGKPTYASIDLDKLRSLQLTVTAADGGVAGAAEIRVMGVPNIKPTPESGLICVHSVTDLAGRADFVFDDGGWAIYASDGRAHGLLILEPGQAAGAQTLQMVNMPTMRLRVLDTQGRPVRGAHLQVQLRSRRARPGQANNAKQWARLAFGWHVTSDMIATARSTDDGTMVVPVPDWVAGHGSYLVRAGARVSEEVKVVSGGDLGDVIVREGVR